MDGALDLAVALGWDLRRGASGGDDLENGPRVVAAVGDDVVCGSETVEQSCYSRLVRSLAGAEHEAQWQPLMVDDDVDLAAQSSTRTANGVIRAPFLPPAACWWARTIELSMN